MKVISPIGARTDRGPISLYLAGRRSCQTLGGSMTWSSTEMIFGKSPMAGDRSADLTRCQPGNETRSSSSTMPIDTTGAARPPGGSTHMGQDAGNEGGIQIGSTLVTLVDPH